MFFTYLRRELIGRRKQTALFALGMAIAIALEMIVSGFSKGVTAAQAGVLESVYVVGPDMTVPATSTAPGKGAGGPQWFDFDRGDGNTAGGTQSVSTSMLTTGPGNQTMDASALESILAVDGVEGASATRTLNKVTFDGRLAAVSQTEIPAPSSRSRASSSPTSRRETSTRTPATRSWTYSRRCGARRTSRSSSSRTIRGSRSEPSAVASSSRAQCARQPSSATLVHG